MKKPNHVLAILVMLLWAYCVYEGGCYGYAQYRTDGLWEAVPIGCLGGFVAPMIPLLFLGFAVSIPKMVIGVYQWIARSL